MTKLIKCTLCGKEEGLFALTVSHKGDDLFFVACCQKCRESKTEQTIDYFFPKGAKITDEERIQLLRYIRDKCLGEGKFITRSKLLKIRKRVKEHPIDIILDTESTRSLVREIRNDSGDAKYREVDRKRKLHR